MPGALGAYVALGTWGVPWLLVLPIVVIPKASRYTFLPAAPVGAGQFPAS